MVDWDYEFKTFVRRIHENEGRRFVVDFQRTPFTLTQANAVYDILMKYAGSNERGRESFVFHQTSKSPPDEYRFCGELGFGGKFYRDWKRLFVSCYREDEDEKTLEMIRVTNERLAALTAVWKDLK